MTSPEQFTHAVAVELLPWLVSGSLSSDEALATRDHAQNCVICRREMESLKLFQEQISLVPETVAAPAPDMRAINRRIDDLIERQKGWRDALLRLRVFAQSPWRVAFVAQSIALLVLASLLLAPNSPRSVFTTLSNPPAITNAGSVRIVFSPQLGEQALSDMLNEYQLSIIGGPTERGVYTLESNEQLGDHALSQLIESLQNRKEILFAQAITGDH